MDSVLALKTWNFLTVQLGCDNMNFSRAGPTATSVGNLETGLSCSTEQLDSSHFQLMTGSDLWFRNQFSVAQPSLKTFLLSSCFLPASSMNSLAVISLQDAWMIHLDTPIGLASGRPGTSWTTPPRRPSSPPSPAGSLPRTAGRCCQGLRIGRGF